MEMEAVFSSDGSCSISDLSRALSRSTAEDLEDVDFDSHADEEAEEYEDGSLVREPGDLAQLAAEETFAECDRRASACGGGSYPFALETGGGGGGALVVKPDWHLSPYGFLLMCTHYVRTTKDGTKNFPAAVDDLCSRLGEGEGHSPTSNAKKQKDGKLDVVVWRHFADRRPGKLIAFGQCATGHRDWRTKLSEMQPQAFISKFIRGTIGVLPVRLYFVPWCSPAATWRENTIDSGIIFDRCRLAEFLSNVPSPLNFEYQQWTARVFKAQRSKRK